MPPFAGGEERLELFLALFRAIIIVVAQTSFLFALATGVVLIVH